MVRRIALLLCIAVSANAEDLYVSQSGAGTKDGSSPANAFAHTDATTAIIANGSVGAGAGKWSTGDTLFVCGTVSPTVGQTLPSGTSGLILDGDCPGNPGVIDFSAVTAQQYGLRVQNAGAVITDLTIYCSANTSTNSCVLVNGSSVTTGTEISRNTILGINNKSTRGIQVDSTVASPSVLIHENTVQRVGIGIQFGGDAGARGSIYNNDISALTYYLLTNTDGIAVNGASTTIDYARNLKIYDNEITGFDDDGIDLAYGKNVDVYGNYVYNAEDDSGNGNCFKLGLTSAGNTNWVYRNKCINPYSYCVLSNGGDSQTISGNICDCTTRGLTSNSPCIGLNSNSNTVLKNTILGGTRSVKAFTNNTGQVLTNNIMNPAAGGASVDLQSGAAAVGTKNCRSLANTGDGTYTDVSDITSCTAALNADYSLVHGSTLIDAGVYVYPCDSFGGKCLGAPDVGGVDNQIVPTGYVSKPNRRLRQ